jgi:hypothetical protein
MLIIPKLNDFHKKNLDIPISLQLSSFIEKNYIYFYYSNFSELVVIFLMIYKSSEKKSYNYDK